MNISYDIFDIADCPVIITDKNFTIIYKNNLASKFFCGFRKKSKISRHFHNVKNDTDFSEINELDIETGTQFMRALVLPIDENILAFLFFSIYAFTDINKLISYVREHYSGNLMDFYCKAYREYEENVKYGSFAKRNISERAYAELLSLMSFFTEKPVFMQTEVYNISELLQNISKKFSGTLPAFGLQISNLEIEETDCYAKINLNIFCFVIFRMIYMAFRLSDKGKIQISLDSSHYPQLEIYVSTHTNINPDIIKNKDFASLADIFPEFSFEFEIFKKAGFFDNILSFSLDNFVFKLRYNIKCETGFFTLRSEGAETRQKRIDAAISNAFAQIKNLLSNK